MKITDFVKPGLKTTGHILIASNMFQPKEQIRFADIVDCSVNDDYKDTRLVVLTSHRILFVNGFASPPHKLAFELSNCIGVGEITGPGLTKHMDITCNEDRITITGKAGNLRKLSALTLDTIETYPNQPAIRFEDSTTAAAIRPTFIAAPEVQAPAAASLPPKAQAKQRIKDNHAAGVACCPKCGSTSLSANKKGFSAGKAAAGMFLSSSLAGAVAGEIGANKVEITCLNCGHKFKPGKK